MINLWWVASAVLVIGLAVFHSLLGELFLVRRLLRRENLPRLFGEDEFTKLTLRYAWHLLSIVWVGMGALLLWASGSENGTAGRAVGLVGLTQAASAAWVLIATRGRHLSGIVLLAAAVLAWAGMWSVGGSF